MYSHLLKKERDFFCLGSLRLILLFLFFLPIQANLNANKKIDSLVALLKNQSNDPHRVDLLNQLAGQVLEEDHVLATSYSEEALALAEKINYSKGKYESNYLLGKINVNYTLDFSKAIIYFKNALENCRKNDHEQRSRVLSQLAFLNKRQGNLDKAIYYYKEVLQIAQAENNLKEVSTLSSYLAEIYEQTGDRNRVLFYLKNVMDIEKQTNFKNSSPIAFISIAHYYELRKQWAPAETYLLEALKIFEAQNNHRWESYTYALLSKLYVQKKNYLAARDFAIKGLNIATKYHLSKEVTDNHYFLSEVYDSLRDYKKAFIHFKALKNIEDSIFNINKVKEIANIQSVYESNVKQESVVKANLEKELSELQLKKTQIALATTFIMIVLLAILLIVLIKNYKIKQAVNLQLENRDELRKLKLDEIIKNLNNEIIEHRHTKAKLEITNAELNNFMYSSSHDLKAPLAAIAGLSNLAVANVSEKERLEYIMMISKSASKLSALIDDMVQTTKVTHGNIEITTIIFLEVADNITQEIKNLEYAKGVTFMLQVDKNLMLNTDKTLLRTILYNLIENAVKYKNPAKKGPYVRICVENENNLLKISVMDNGIGINIEDKKNIFEMFSRFNKTMPGTGLGLYLVKKAVIKLGGEIHVESKEGEGSVFELALPNLLHVQVNAHVLKGNTN
jgi:signal transduction histidine kinase/tetratricopeptide (TPR) repeat protein